MTAPPPRLVPDRPSAEFPTPSPAAVKKAKDEAATRQFPSEMHWASWVIDRAREIDAAAPPRIAGERDAALTQLAAAPAAPAPVAVAPDARFPCDGNGDEDAYNQGWNDCRAFTIASKYAKPNETAPRVTGGRESITGVVNGYLHRAQCVEFKADSPLPAWLTASPGLRVTMTLQAATGGEDA